MTTLIIEPLAGLRHSQDARQPKRPIEPPLATLRPHTEVSQPSRNVLIFNWDVLVSHCDDADFDGDWRYSAFCPDIDVAMDGRSPEEAYSLLENAIRIKLADCADVQQAIVSSVDRDEAVSDFLEDGRLYEKIAIRMRVVVEEHA